jgi:NADH:ubiquinone oxidoreductase subunit C
VSKVDVETIRDRLGTDQELQKRGDGWWLHDPELDVVAMAKLMVEANARLATMTARVFDKSSKGMTYHWDLNGQLFNVSTKIPEDGIPSIAEICPAADWIEREIHDYFATNFVGRKEMSRLLLCPHDKPGMFHWNGKKGDSQ